MVKNPPANAGDTGSSPGLGRSHMLRSNLAHAPQLLSLRLEPMSHNYRACVLQLLKPTHLEPVLRNKRSHHNEKPVRSSEDPMQPKKKIVYIHVSVRIVFPVNNRNLYNSSFKEDCGLNIQH